MSDEAGAGRLNRVRAIILALAVAANAGCSTLYFYGQAVVGHARIIAASRDIDGVLERGAVDDMTTERLRQVVAIRAFAVDTLALPDNGSYTRYADIDRDHVVWNVFAAPEFSVDPLTWCYPIAGCAAYRGYFSEHAARRFAGRLEQRGFDVFVGGVDAYSTLGRLADPVLSTFLDYSPTETAALVFHELAHQRVYAPGDAAFNESFATVVEETGVARWLESHGAHGSLKAYRRSRRYQEAVSALMTDYRDRFAALYAEPLGDDARHRLKREKFDALYAEYGALRREFAADAARTEIKRSRFNNALVSSYDLYHRYVPALRRMLAARAGDLAAFYADCDVLAATAPERRLQRLEHVMQGEDEQ
jgi:predicted aminopeptidase